MRTSPQDFQALKYAMMQTNIGRLNWRAHILHRELDKYKICLEMEAIHSERTDKAWRNRTARLERAYQKAFSAIRKHIAHVYADCGLSIETTAHLVNEL